MKFELEVNKMAIPGQFTSEQVMAVAAVAEAQQDTVRVYDAETGLHYGTFGTVFMARRFFNTQNRQHPKLKNETERTKMFTLEDATEMRKLAEKLNRAVEESLKVGEKNGGFQSDIQNCLVDANYGMGTVVDALRELEVEVAKYDTPEDWNR